MGTDNTIVSYSVYYNSYAYREVKNTLDDLSQFLDA
jgi:hypothetical protein